jgi:hypothetical protein
MIEKAKNDELLADVLAEGDGPAVREVLLGETLRLVRRRRQIQHGRRWASALAAVAACVWLMRWVGPVAPPAAKPYLLVRTQPLARLALIRTQPLAAACIVNSRPTTALLTTIPAGETLHQLTDDDLLALAPTPAILVRHGPHMAELVFAPPFDDRHN